jgi:lipopolysaccharide/colanic/teichoic acid biosynthesis glycosyltransferase
VTALLGATVVIGGLACAAVVATLHSILTQEVRSWMPHIARGLVRSAARRLREGERERYQDEWLAELEAWSDRPASSIFKAASIRWHARSMRTSLDGDTSASDKVALAVKHQIDLVVGLAAIAVLLPTLLACALAVRLTSSGPVLYAQRRIGRDMKPFTVWKLRTMYLRSGDRQPELTPVGRLLRRFALDQLPELWSVVRGEMSLVGPRPLSGHEFEHRPKISPRPLQGQAGIDWSGSGQRD